MGSAGGAVTLWLVIVLVCGLTVAGIDTPVFVE